LSRSASRTTGRIGLATQTARCRSFIIPAPSAVAGSRCGQLTFEFMNLSLKEALVSGMAHTRDQYIIERRKRGSQRSVAKLLKIAQSTIARREAFGPIDHESWIALLSLPVKPAKLSTSNP
jgi:hypothetical protein